MKNKKSIWNKISCVVLTVVTIFTANPMPTQAEIYWPQAPQVTSPDAIVIEVNSGAVLYEKNCDTVRYPASITKVLTTLLALENCALDEVVTFSADAVFKNEGDTSHIARDLDEQMTMEECLYGVMLESANECAYAVAEHVGAKLGGDYRTFIDLMNQRAKELGCTNTHFNNANGLPDTEHWTSARDMALISAEAYRNETFRIITGTKAYQIPPTNKHVDITYLNNHHQMLHYYKTSKYLYEYCTGGKTGYTQAAGSTLVTFAEKDGMALVCVVMNTTGQDQYLDTTALFEYCFQNFKSYNIAEHKEYITAHEKSKGVMNNQSSYVTLDESATVVLPVSASFSDAQFSITEQENKGDIVATLSYMYADRMVGSV
ncbi:MAG: D-alanyl-D-alanine carboxypeptidase, partial [Lachnospiraceae bacterium]|nr:D-alanyl-D-alanine carboxypeptidase [Lachnospiraceae bacterium]